MEFFELPDSELAEMKQFYQEEFDKTVRRLQHIRTILKQLGADAPTSEPGMFSSSEFLTGPLEAAKSGPSKPKRKNGRKSRWELLIMKRMRQLDKPVTYDELTDEIMAFSRLPANKRTSTKQAVVNVVFRLRNRDKKLDTFSVGTRVKYIALRGWFDKPGQIKKEYSARISSPKQKPNQKSRRVGRPKKTARQ